MIRIKHASNGFIIETDNMDEDGGTSIDVIEADGYSNPNPSVENLEGLRTLLYAVMDWAGYYGSKHSAYRLRPVIELQHVPEKLVDKLCELDESPDMPHEHHAILEKY